MRSLAETFQSSEQIICKKLKKQLEFWYARHPPSKRGPFNMDDDLQQHGRLFAIRTSSVLMVNNSRFIMMMMMMMMHKLQLQHNHQQGMARAVLEIE